MHVSLASLNKIVSATTHSIPDRQTNVHHNGTKYGYHTEALGGHRVVWKIEICYRILMT